MKNETHEELKQIAKSMVNFDCSEFGLCGDNCPLWSEKEDECMALILSRRAGLISFDPNA